MRQRKERKAMLIISELSGMKHSKYCCIQWLNIQRLGVGQNAEMELCDNFFLQFLFYLQIMKSSTWFLEKVICFD